LKILHTIETFITCIRHLTAFAVLLCMPGVISAAELNESPEIDEESQDTWYQIELIVFSNQRITPSTEHWPAQTLRYPASMLTIGPNLDEQTSPRSLNQLKILEADQLLSDTRIDIIGAETSNSEFLFDDPDRGSPDRSSLDSDLLEDDLLAGLTHERLPEVDTTVLEEYINEVDNAFSEIMDDAGEVDKDFIEVVDEAGELDSLQPSLDLLFQQDPALQAFRMLPDTEFTLDDMAKRINRSSSYHLLYHAAWRQPVQPMDQAIPILLQAGDQYDAFSELDGIITISRARYLHIDTDLWFTIFSPRSGQASMVMPDNTLNYPEADRELLRQYPEINLFESRRNNYLPVQTYRMVQSRRMRSSTLHYLDHPAFSLLITVEKFSFPDIDSATNLLDLQPLPQSP
jgi:hypothetical protein